MSRTPLVRPAPLPELPPEFAYLDEEPEPTGSRTRRRRRRVLTALFYLLLTGIVLFLGRYVRADDGDPIVVPAVPAATAGVSTEAPSAPAPASPAPHPHEAGTSGKFRSVTGYGPVLGTAGPIRRFRVVVEQPVSADAAADFADEVNRALGDPRSWIHTRKFRLQRVPMSAKAEFTVFLASARSSEEMCRKGGLETDGYTSCRLSEQVIINDDRWVGSVRGYGAPLSTYRQYVINHEVGHQFGHGHESCLGKGRRAPVMMQQTYGLKGCLANPWPYPDAARP
ncbi:DUF3152 domain-containing protein [Paractinoplanes rishiriensis]|uniref:DUF3152 domain-containing protein n=1 Tax=Paractinoplanes rishiriensis TaxID=1050105 RepID=A0A919MQI3_9ACTN|nr:DUF3152 domain-containing protein [Actinoplanes rishiriensis]GIE96186.1 hypothetical protein Ari01nite_36510 [Actinoplanes rishiriensis]